MFTLLSSLAHYGSQGVLFSDVVNWTQSGITSSQTANLAYQKHYLRIERRNAVNFDFLHPEQSQGDKYVLITPLGLKYLRELKQNADYGHPKWNPNKRLEAFLNTYSDDDE